MSPLDRFLHEHWRLTRRYFVRMGVASVAAGGLWARDGKAHPASPALAEAVALLEPHFTLQEDFRDVSKGKPLPHSLPEDMAGLAPGRCDGRKSTGRRFCRDFRPASTCCAVARSTPRGSAQPMPRPFRKSGHAAIETVRILVKGYFALPSQL